MRHRSKMSGKERAVRSKVTKLIHDYPFIEGGIVKMARVCGKDGCKCTKGEKHVSWYLATRHEKKRKMIYIPAEMEKEVKDWGKVYKEIRKLMKDISSNYLKILIEAKNRKKSRGNA